MKYSCLFYATVWFLTSLTCVAQARFQSLDSLFKQYQQHDDFNGMVLIAQSGQEIFSRSIGYANFEKQMKLDIIDVILAELGYKL